jgi:hypothetical protein
MTFFYYFFNKLESYICTTIYNNNVCHDQIHNPNPHVSDDILAMCLGKQ